MNSAAPRYDRWKAPADDGHTLLWPAAGELLNDTLQNSRLLREASGVLVQNISLAEVRRRMRQVIGHEDDNQPLVATGHQTELHHPGVWVKNVLIDAVATKLGGRAIHFAVDTDEPKHLKVTWPGGSVPLSDESQPAAAWSGLLPPPTLGHLGQVAEAVETAASKWSFKPVFPRFFESMETSVKQAANLPAALTSALHELDKSLGLRHEAVLFSPLCSADSYLLFAHHVLARADTFAADYNASLDEYRQENHIRTPGRPMPDLKVEDGRIEVPFWLDDLRTGNRSRANVVRDADGFALHFPGRDRFVFRSSADGWAAAGALKNWIGQQGLRLAPRALTLTAVLRLLVADQFVHGIGGGQYDQVLDKLILRHFHLSPPRFAVTTATLFFPEAAGKSRICLPCMVREGHSLRHGVLGAEKTALVEAIASAPRGSTQRATLFMQMHAKLNGASRHPDLLQWERRYSDAIAASKNQRSFFDRELFYALQPQDRLASLIGRYRHSFPVGT